MSTERKYFETKIINGYDFSDYWGLQSHPLFLSFDKSNKPYFMHIDEVRFEGSIKVSNLTDIRNALYKNVWVFEDKYWKKINQHIQTAIDVPWTPL